jgi:hypothetical protein
MNLMNRMVSLLTAGLESFRPVQGTTFERIVQRICRQCGWEVENFSDNRVYFRVHYDGRSTKACISLEPNCLSRVIVVGEIAVHSEFIDDYQQFFSQLNSRPKATYHYQLVPAGEKIGHAITWTIPLDMIRKEILSDVLPEMIRNSRNSDDFAVKLADIRIRCEREFGTATNERN